jgi:hypothetical protein
MRLSERAKELHKEAQNKQKVEDLIGSGGLLGASSGEISDLGRAGEFDVPYSYSHPATTGFATALGGAGLGGALGYSLAGQRGIRMGAYGGLLAASLLALYNKSKGYETIMGSEIDPNKPSVKSALQPFRQRAEESAAFEQSLEEKEAGTVTEILGHVNPINILGGNLYGLVKANKPAKDIKELEEIDKDTWSNLFIPGRAAYNNTRRNIIEALKLRYEQKKDAEYKKTEEGDLSKVTQAALGSPEANVMGLGPAV